MTSENCLKGSSNHEEERNQKSKIKSHDFSLTAFNVCSGIWIDFFN